MFGSWRTAVAGLIALLATESVVSIQLDTNSEDSIRAVASTLAHGLQSYYKNNQSNTAPLDVGTLGNGYYWWEGGAMWGGLIDYWAYTGDTSFEENIKNALVAQMGPNRDLMNEQWYDQTGNDDQAFWALSMMSAVELGFPNPPPSSPQYLEVAVNVFNSQVARWDTAGCNGGLRWQVFEKHPGYQYMNTVSNGAFFQLAARLARFTGNQTYVDWAQKSWDWMRQVNVLTEECTAYDGTASNVQCKEVNHLQWSYNIGIIMNGAANLYNLTGSQVWADRTTCMLNAASVFFSPYDNSTNVMYEAACEQVQTCNQDQQSFKAFLGRWMAKSTILAPFTRDAVFTFLTASANAAARSCSGGSDGVTCGTKWYTEGWDGTYGAGQQLTALEVIQSLLVHKGGAPRKAPDVDLGTPISTTQVDVPSKTAEVETFVPTSTTASATAVADNQGKDSGATAFRTLESFISFASLAMIIFAFL